MRGGHTALLAGLIAVIFGVTSPRVGAAEVALSDSTLTIRELEPEYNVLSVESDGLGYSVYDDGAQLLAGPGCEAVSPRSARCMGLALSVEISAGALNDLVVIPNADVRVSASGGSGDDLIETGGAGDRLEGGEGVDSLVGHGGEDLLFGEEGDDLVQGGEDADRLFGGDGADILQGEAGDDDVLRGGLGRDLLRGGDGDDVLHGEAGDDALIGGAGQDTIKTGTGQDDVFADDEDADQIDCRRGDRLRRDRSDQGGACGTVPRVVRRPRAWPPRRTATSSFVPPDPRVKAKLIRRGHARKIAVRVIRNYDEAVRIRVRTYSRKRRKLKDFRKVIRSRHWRSFGRPKPGLRAYHVRGKCCG
jgi:hypothetical protein